MKGTRHRPCYRQFWPVPSTTGFHSRKYFTKFPKTLAFSNRMVYHITEQVRPFRACRKEGSPRPPPRLRTFALFSGGSLPSCWPASCGSRMPLHALYAFAFFAFQTMPTTTPTSTPTTTSTSTTTVTSTTTPTSTPPPTPPSSPTVTVTGTPTPTPTAGACAPARMSG